jgi:hypothetical protein
MNRKWRKSTFFVSQSKRKIDDSLRTMNDPTGERLLFSKEATRNRQRITTSRLLGSRGRKARGWEEMLTTADDGARRGSGRAGWLMLSCFENSKKGLVGGVPSAGPHKMNAHVT